MRMENEMTDNEIRQILTERKRRERKAQRRAEIKEIAEGIIGWTMLFAGGYFAIMIGYAAGLN